MTNITINFEGLSDAQLDEIEVKLVSERRRRAALAAPLTGGVAVAEAAAPEEITAAPEVLSAETIAPYHTLLATKVSEAIGAGILPGEYVLPELEAFADELAELAPEYEKMRQFGWAPEVVFYPQGLLPEEMSPLLKGHDRGIHGTTSEAAVNCNPRQNNALIPLNTERFPAQLAPGEAPWKVALMSAPEQNVVFPNVAADGSTGQNLPRLTAELQAFTGKSDLTVAELIEEASPTAQMYLAQQWQRLLGGQTPIGASGGAQGIMLRERISDPKAPFENKQLQCMTGEWPMHGPNGPLISSMPVSTASIYLGLNPAKA